MAAVRRGWSCGGDNTPAWRVRAGYCGDLLDPPTLVPRLPCTKACTCRHCTFLPDFACQTQLCHAVFDLPPTRSTRSFSVTRKKQGPIFTPRTPSVKATKGQTRTVSPNGSHIHIPSATQQHQIYLQRQDGPVDRAESPLADAHPRESAASFPRRHRPHTPDSVAPAREHTQGRRRGGADVRLRPYRMREVSCIPANRSRPVQKHYLTWPWDH